MMIEYRQEPICVSEAAITAFSQAYTEADIIVPDIKPDIAKVLQVDANAVVTSKECQTDKIVAEGKVSINILYIGDDNTVKSINSVQNFRHSMDAKGAEDGMKAELECDVENVEFEVVNSRKINVRTLIGIDVRVVMPLDINAITDAPGADCEILYRKIKPYSIVSRVEENINIKERLEVPVGKPNIATVLKTDVRIRGAEIKVAQGKLIIKGTLCVTTLYLGDMDENVMQFMEHEFAFTEIIDADGAQEGMSADLDFTVINVSFDLEHDSDGDCRILIADIDIMVSGKVARQNEIDIIEDIYSTKDNLCVAKSTAMLDKMVFKTKVQAAINDVANIPGDLPEIVQIYNIIAKPYLSETRIENGKIVAAGVIDTYILYLSDNASFPIYTYKHENKFSQYVDAQDVSDDMFCEVKIDVEHVSYNIGMGREIQLRFILSIDATVVSTEKIEYVSEITRGEEPEQNAQKPKCCIKIYFVQKGDRLWDIAKKYKTTVESLMIANDITEEKELTAGTQIIIP
jgi:hypothetical protein